MIRGFNQYFSTARHVVRKISEFEKKRKEQQKHAKRMGPIDDQLKYRETQSERRNRGREIRDSTGQSGKFQSDTGNIRFETANA